MFMFVNIASDNAWRPNTSCLLYMASPGVMVGRVAPLMFAAGGAFL